MSFEDIGNRLRDEGIPARRDRRGTENRERGIGNRGEEGGGRGRVAEWRLLFAR